MPFCGRITSMIRVRHRQGSIALGRLVKKILFNLILLATVGLVFIIASFLYYAKQIPDPTVIAQRRVTESTKIYDHTGDTILYDIHGEERRTVVAWEQMPQTVKNATLASEDYTFYNHAGIDFKGILRAVYVDLLSLSASQGGSTITQQLVKNSLLGQEKTYSRKIKEVILSLELERRFTKDQIFWMYLNQIPYGSN